MTTEPALTLVFMWVWVSDYFQRNGGRKVINGTVSRGDNKHFLGLHFDFNRTTRDVSIIQPGYVSKILGDDMYKMVETPHTTELFSINDNAEILCEQDREKFHIIVARCLYLALRTRPDILVATNFLSTRVKKGTTTSEDRRKLDRLCGYLRSTMHLGLRLGANTEGNFQLFAYADAAYGVHPDAKSHSGMFFSFGRGAINVKSCKQKCVTRSSCRPSS